jgi:hypothetical protein
MPTFMDSLARNPSGGSGIYGQGGQQGQTQGQALELVNQLKDREMRDFKEKSNFMSDLSLKQDRMRAMFDPSKTATEQNQGLSAGGQSGGANLPQGFSAVMAPQQSHAETEYQKGELGIRQQGMNLESQKIAQAGKFGQEREDTRAAQEKLNQQKSDQIHQQKIEELTSKNKTHEDNIKLAQDKLKLAGDDFNKQLEAHKQLAAAVEERHKNELALKDLQFEKTKNDHKDAMKVIEDKAKAAAAPVTKTEEVNKEGNKKTTTTTKGGSVQVTGKDGQTYEIPADKVEEWNKTHAPEPQGDQPPASEES